MDNTLKYAPCGFLSFRDDGTIIAVNQTLKEILGYSEENLEGRSFESLLTVASRIFYNTHFFPLIRLHSKADEIFLTLLGKNKTDVPVLSNSVRRLMDGVYENHCVFIPVYQRKKFEEEIINAKRLAEETLKRNEALTSLKEKLENNSSELDKQITKLLAVNENLVEFNKIISHDFQEPIRKIQIFTDLILVDEGINLNVKSKNTLEKIHKAAERLRQLTLALEQFVKIESEKNFSTVDLNDMLYAAKDKLQSESQLEEFDLINEGLPVIKGYPAQLAVLFFHLLNNAYKYRDPSRRLVITVRSVAVQENVFRSTKDRYKFVEYTKILVSDNGIGFENQYSAYVFEMLKKIDAQSKGVGLGLPLSKKIVENHSGTISIHSEKGKGTEVRILLPIDFS